MNDTAAIDDGSQLCVDCGMCCDGTMFASVTITDPSEAERTRAQRIPVHVVDERHLFDLPCPALGGGGCSIYADRPLLCRSYRCLLLKKVDAGETPLPDAQRVLAATRQQEHEVRALLSQHVPDGGTPLRELYRRFRLDNSEQFDSPEFQSEHAELLQRYSAYQTDLALHFEPSIATD